MSIEVTIHDTWIHADACPFIVTVKCGVCQNSVAELCRVRTIGNADPETAVFCRQCADYESRSGKIVEIGWMQYGELVKYKL